MEHRSNLILPLGAYKQSNPAKSAPDLDARILGLPHASMASITLHSTFDHHNATPAHLRDQLPPLVEFSSHSKPPGKTGKNQVLVQVYAVAVDQVDVRAVDEKGRGDVGKYVPGRSFVGRALVVGTDEKEVVRGDVVMGLLDIRKVKKTKAAYPGGAFFVKSLTITFFLTLSERRIGRVHSCGSSTCFSCTIPYPSHTRTTLHSPSPRHRCSAMRPWLS